MPPRSKTILPSTTDSSSSGSSNGSGSTILSLSDMKMGLDNKQRDLIMMDMAASRKKLEEENRTLRDELEEAHLTIRLLKYKLADQMRTTKSSSNGGGLGSASPATLGWFRSKEPKITKKDIREFEKATNQQFSNSKKRVKAASFDNPNAPGSKVFTPKKGSENDRYDTNNRPAVIEVPVVRSLRKEKPNPSSKQRSKPASVTTKTSSRSPQVNRRPIKITQATDVMQHRSVMDRLALSIIEEHRRFDDGLFVDNDSDQ